MVNCSKHGLGFGKTKAEINSTPYNYCQIRYNPSVVSELSLVLLHIERLPKYYVPHLDRLIKEHLNTRKIKSMWYFSKGL